MVALVTSVVGLGAVWGVRAYLAASMAHEARGFPPGVPEQFLASRAPGEPITVPLVALLARPREFDGRSIRVVGFGHLEFEGDALYLHREDFAQNLVTNSVRLEVPLGPAFKAFNDKYVVVEGIFEAAGDSSRALRPGSIRRISRYDPMPSHAELERETLSQH
jgi:hypothetical protein